MCAKKDLLRIETGTHWKFMFHNGFVYCMHFDDIFGLIEHNVPMIEAAMNIRGACTWQAARKCDLKFCFRGCWSMKCSAKPMNFGSEVLYIHTHIYIYIYMFVKRTTFHAFSWGTGDNDDVLLADPSRILDPTICQYAKSGPRFMRADPSCGGCLL